MMVGMPDILNASILIVDDQESNVSLLEQLLRATGYTRVASTMNQSVREVRQVDPRVREAAGCQSSPATPPEFADSPGQRRCLSTRASRDDS